MNCENEENALFLTLPAGQSPPVTILPQYGPYSIHIEDCDIKDEVRMPLRRLFRRYRQIIPSSSQRYSKNEIAFPSPLVFYPDPVSSSETNTSSLFAFVPEPYTQEGWESYTHPEGLKYYYHPRHRVLTDANLELPFIYTKVDYWVNDFFQTCSTHSIDLPPSYEVVLELHPDDDGTCGYYAVDNERQTVFWLDPADTAELGLPDVVSTKHSKLQLHRQYWRHMEYFPAHRAAPKSVQHTLTGILSHAWADGTTSNLSTSPQSPEACKEFLDIINNFTGKPAQEPYRTCIIGRLMDEFTQARFINLYGEAKAVRLANNQSVFQIPIPKASAIYDIASIMLLRQPEKELERLNNLWVDKIAYTASWRRFIREQIDEWKNVIIVSLVFTLFDILLVLNLRTYASMSIWSNYFPQVIAYQLALISSLFNVSSTLIGLVAISAHTPYHNTTASNAASYFTNAWHNTQGFKPLALVLSLPRSLLIWALTGTSLSIVALSLETLNTLTLLFTGGFTIVLGILTFWAIAFLHVGNNPMSLGLADLKKMLTRKY